MNGLDFGTAIGLIKGLGSPDPAVIESAVSDWLDDHPEATTTVQDGSITKAKLDSNLQGTVDDVADLKSQMDVTFSAEIVMSTDIQLLIPSGALLARFDNVDASITKAQIVGPNLYRHETIPTYTYNFYVSTINTAKNQGVRLPVGSYIVSFDTAAETNRPFMRCWRDNGDLINATNNAYVAASYKDGGAYQRFIWESYRFVPSMGNTQKYFYIDVLSEPLWFLFCNDNAAQYAPLTSVQIEYGAGLPTAYQAYTSREITPQNIADVSGQGMIQYTASGDSTDSIVAFLSLPVKNTADTYAEGVSYSIGDYCVYGGLLYKCVKAIETSGVFDTREWNSVLIMDEIGAINATMYSNAHNPYKKAYMQTAKPKIFAHSGATNANCPENTLAAYNLAGEMGFYGIEADVQETVDGHFVMMHDNTVDRTTDGSGSIADMTLAQVQALHIKDHPDMGVPTLEEYLAVCRMYGAIPNIEIKATVKVESLPTLIQTVKDAGMYEMTIFSGSYYNVVPFRAADDCAVYLVIGQSGGGISYQAIINKAKAYPLMGVALEASGTITPDMIAECHTHSIPIALFAASTADSTRQMYAAGADMVIAATQGIIPEQS